MICIDELGPLAAKTYLGKGWAPVNQPPRVVPDYGRRAFLWVFGAFEPKTGKALTHCAYRRRSQDFLAFLDKIVKTWTQSELVFILDNLRVHKTIDVQLWALAHPHVRFLFQPTYAPWLYQNVTKFVLAPLLLHPLVIPPPQQPVVSETPHTKNPHDQEYLLD